MAVSPAPPRPSPMDLSSLVDGPSGFEASSSSNGHSFYPSDALSPRFPVAEEDEDERVRTAIAALGSMRTGSSTPGPSAAQQPVSIPLNGPYRTHSSSNTTTSSGPPTPASTSAVSIASQTDPASYMLNPDGEIVVADAEDPRFFNRVSQLPLVSGALRAYEGARNSNRALKYSTDVIGSGVKTISKPVFDRFSASSPPQPQNSTLTGLTTPTRGVYSPDSSAISLPPMQTSPGGESELADAETSVDQNGAVVHAPRSRWQALIVEAGLTAGGIGAAVSDEGIKSLRYCLQWLQYASARLDQQILALRELIVHVTVTRSPDGTTSESRAVVVLDDIKRDVVDTIRRVVDVVSLYAGAALPEHARRFVRQSILSLPVRWAQSMAVTPGTPVPDGTPNLSKTNAAAERVMAFAVESLDMLRTLTQIFGDSAERAELWLERLRHVGLAHRERLEVEAGGASTPIAVAATPESLRQRTSAARSSSEEDDSMQL